jgi:hypothetical protein
MCKIKNSKIVFNIFIILIIFIFLKPINASTIDAQNIAREYSLNNEYIDSRVFQISCEDQDFIIISVVDAKNNLIFFVPITEDREVYTQNNNLLQEIYKTSYFLRQITTQNSNNFLTITLVDSIDQLLIILKSKQSQLQGIINTDYSANITSATQETKEKITALIDLLETLKQNTEDARKEQQSFVDDPKCGAYEGVVRSLRDAFVGYNNLTAYGIDYQTSINKITEKIVSETEISETTKMVISGYVSAPPSLSKDISNIQEKLSSTNFFYLGIVNEMLKVGESNVAIIALNNFLSRQNYVEVVSLLYDYDSELKNTLDNVVISILDDNTYPYWKNKTTLEALKKNFDEINNLVSKKRYSEALPKIKLLKSQAIKIESDGFIDISDVNQGFNYYGVIIAVVFILFLVIVLKNLKNKPKKPKKKNLKKNILNNFDKKDPFK